MYVIEGTSKLNIEGMAGFCDTVGAGPGLLTKADFVLQEDGTPTCKFKIADPKQVKLPEGAFVPPR